MLKILLAACAACVAVMSGSASAAETSNLAIYGRLPQYEEVKVSPDGSKLAMVMTNGDERFVIVRTVAGQQVAGIKAGNTKLRGVTWAGEDHVIVVSSQTTEVFDLQGPAREYFMALDFNLTTKKQSLLLRSQPNAMNVILGSPMVRTLKGQTVVFLEGMYFESNTGLDALFRVNLKDGYTKMIDGARFDTDGWLVDAAGEPVAQSMYDGKKGRWSLLMKIGGNWKKVDEADSPMGSYGISGFGRDGKSVLVWRTDDKNRDFLREYRGVDQHEDLPGDLPLDGLIHDPDTLALLGGYQLKGDDLTYTFFDPAAQKTWNSVVKAFPGERVTLASWSKNRRRVVVRVDSPVEGPAFAFVDLDTKQASWLGDIYKDVGSKTISEVRSIKYKAADGLEISGYLTLPKGRDPKNLPLIVLPHGGPEGRDEPGFDWWSQALASRGYAVLQPNFRGSEGFGWDFVKAGFGEWGKKMQTDLSDGVRHLAKQGIIDPKRVCVVGASYGGYAALAGATLDKGVYRCAVAVAGVADLKKFLQTNIRLNNGEVGASQRYWLRFMGADGAKDPDLTAISPAQQAAKVDIPILLIHGKDDTVVRYDQSQAMADALKKAGKPFQFVTLDGEDHWLSRGATRQKMLNETVAFVEKNNPPN